MAPSGRLSSVSMKLILDCCFVFFNTRFFLPFFLRFCQLDVFVGLKHRLLGDASINDSDLLRCPPFYLLLQIRAAAWL